MVIPFEAFGGSGPPLHFAHANAYPPGSYGRFLRRLTSDFRVLAMHQRPLWPGSSPSELTSWDVFSDDLLRFLDEQQLERVIGVGHSLGGVATLQAALKQPGRFAALVLIEPVLLPPRLLALAAANPDAFAQSPLARVARRRRDCWPDATAVFTHFRGKDVFARWPDETLQEYVAAGLRVAGDAVTLAFPRAWEAAIYASPPLTVWEDIPGLTRPTLGIRGAASDTIVPEAWQLWQAKQPDATFVELPDAGHMLPMERPDALADRVLAYLKGEDVKT